MKGNLCLFGFLLCGIHAMGQLPADVPVNKKLEITFNKNIELLGFAYFIGFEGVNSEEKMVKVGGKDMLEKDWQNYGFDFYQKYKSFATSKNMAAALSVAADLWLSDIIPLLLQVEDFPNARLGDDINEQFYIHFSASKKEAEAKKNATTFLNACNELYKEVNFDQYLQESSVYYQSAIRQLQAHLPSYDFIGLMEGFYRKSFDHYLLLPSLTIPKGMAFGPRYEAEGGTKVFNVFGAYGYQTFKDKENLNMGFGDAERLRELSIHEFGHSFVNPEVYKIPDQMIKATAILFDSLAPAMEKQGYNNWKTCLAEHFVRAGEIIIAKQAGKRESAEKLEKDYIINRKFIYLPIIIKELERYRKNRHLTYSAVLMRCMHKMEEMAAVAK